MRTLEYYLNKPKISNGDVRYFPDYLLKDLKQMANPCVGDIREMLEWIRSGRKDYPACAHCSSTLSSKQWDIRFLKYRTFCGKSCASFFREHSDIHKKKMQEKFGADSVLGSPEIQAKRIATNLIKYGRANPHPWNSAEFADIIKDKYGVDRVRHIPGTNEKIINSIFSQSKQALPNRIKAVEAEFNVICQNEIDISSDLPFVWKHATCGTLYKSNIVSNEIRNCPSCSSGTSILEQEILSFIKEQVDVEIIHRAKGIISPYEIDIFIPSMNLAFEIDGSYWHSAKFVNEKTACRKLNLCAEQKIKLITIQESGWRSAPSLVKDRIKNALGVIATRMGARQCQIIELKPEQKNRFFSQNHLSGDARSSYAYGLVRNSKLISVMSFGKPRFTKKSTWEIIRFASLAGNSVAGGLSKLLNHFIKTHCAAGDSIVTYADRNWGDGGSYAKAGMTFSHMSKSSYFYAGHNHKTFSRYEAQKKKLPAILGEKYDPFLTERDNMERNGYLTIYDRGNMVYKLLV